MANELDELKNVDPLSNTERVTNMMDLSKSSPEEAAQNIERGNFYDMEPDAYVDLKPQLESEVKTAERVPAQIGDVTTDFVTSNPERAALVGNDVSFLSRAENRYNYYKGTIIDGPETGREINNLQRQWLDKGLSEGEQEYLDDLNNQQSELEARKPPEVGTIEGTVTEIAGAAVGIARSALAQLPTIGATTATGATGGAMLGALAPVPGGALVGARLGVQTGFKLGVTLALMKDAYEQTQGSMINTLRNARKPFVGPVLDEARRPQGVALNLEKERIDNISTGVAILSGAIAAIPAGAFVSKNPFLKRFINPKLAGKLVTTSPRLMAKMFIVGGLIKSAMAEGGEEAVQEVISIVGENLAQIDDTEESFLSGLDNLGTAISASATLETGKRAGKSFVIGFGAGATFQAVTSAGGVKGLEERFEQERKVQLKREEVLTNQKVMLEGADDIENTKIKDLSPTETKSFAQKMFEKSGLEDVWFNEQDLKEFGDKGPDEAAIISKLGLTEINTLGDTLNQPKNVTRADVLLDVILEHPEITDMMRTTPDGESPAEIRTNAEEFTARQETAEAARTELISALGDKKVTPEVEEQLRKIQEGVKDPRPFDDEFDFLDSVSFIEMDGLLTQEEAEQLNSTLLNAKLAVSESLKAEVEKKFEVSENRISRDINSKKQRQTLREHEQGLNMLESFADKTNRSEAALAVTNEHKLKGFSPSAIDPLTLPEDLKEIYLKNNVLKKRKVFVEGGIDIEESAAQNGVDTGAELLRLLSETPNRSTLVKARPQVKIDTKNRVSQTLKPARLDAIDKAFSNVTKIYAKEMEFMRTKEWSTLKRGIVKITKRVPRVESINRDAQVNIANTRIGELNPNRYLQGERSSQTLSRQDLLAGRFEQAFLNKEKAMINNEMRREAIKAKENVAKNQKFWKKVISSKSVKQSLKDGGMLKPMEEFMSLYRLDGTSRGLEEQKSFNAFMKNQSQNGEWVPEIPTRLDNTQVSTKELTTSQYQEISDFGRYMVEQSKLKNKLRKTSEARAEAETAERVAESVKVNAQNNINYDVKKLVVNEDRYRLGTENVHNAVSSAISQIANVKSITEEMDEFKPNGFFTQTLANPLKEATTNKRFEIKETSDRSEEMIKIFYKGDEFERMFNTYIDVPEFVGMKQLGMQNNKGGILKTDLLVMQAYMGDPDGRQALTNFATVDGRKLTIPEIQTVLDRELTSNDASFAQAFLVDRFNKFADRSVELHKKTTGTDVELVRGVEVEHKGKVLPGGYYPIKYNMKSFDTQAKEAFHENESKLKQVIDKAEAGIDNLKTFEGQFFAEMASAEMTKQGRLKSRTGSERTLNLSFDNYIGFTEDVVHDLHFRETGIDLLKILKEPENVDHMTAIVGPQKFGTFLNHIKDSISKASDKDGALFSQQNSWVDNLINKAHKVQAVSVIAWNYTSMLVQPVSLGNVVLRLGPKSAVYMTKHAARMLKNPADYAKFKEVAAKINSDIILEQDGVDDSVTKGTDSFLPSTSTFFKNYNGRGRHALRRMNNLADEYLVEAGFAPLRELDTANRVLTTFVASEMFLNGDIETFSKKKVDAMSEAERAKTLREIVQQVSDLSLTSNSRVDRSIIEKNKAAKLFTRFFVDRRAGFNTGMAQVGKIKSSLKRGDRLKATNQIMTTFLVMGGMKAWLSAVRDEEESITNQLGNVENGEEFIGLMGDSLISTLSAPAQLTIDNVPFLDSVFFATQQKRRTDYRTVGTPFDSVRGQVAMTWNAINDILVGNELSKVDKKSILTVLGYTRGGLPTNAMWRTWETLNESETIDKTGDYVGELIIDLKKNIDKYIDDNQGNSEAEQFMNDLKEVRKTLPQVKDDAKGSVPEDATEVIKEVSSQGDWMKVDSDTGAAGIYQFTEDRWLEIMETNPDLGLTENGRVSKDPSQQEQAMSWSVEKYSEGFIDYDIPVTTANLLGAHEFSFDYFIAIHENKGTMKLSKIIGEDAKLPPYNKFKTVRSVKNYLASKVKRIDNKNI